MADPTIIHPTAIVEDGAELGAGVTIGAFSYVGASTKLGAGTSIGTHCLIGEGDDGDLMIGERSIVRSHSVIYGGSAFGDELETGHRVTIRSGMAVGRNLRVGTLGDLQGDAKIGDFVRFHSNVHICQGSTIGNFVWIFPYTVLTNDPHPPSDGCTVGPTIDDYAVIGTHVTILPGIHVGRDTLVAAGSTVTKDVPSGRVAMGSPAKDRLGIEEIQCADGRLAKPYPWWRHFDRGYPESVKRTDMGLVYEA
jgi:UDP-3-O-[3-hydroxymyristoyl] glucosamine N-acyltransferase